MPQWSRKGPAFCVSCRRRVGIDDRFCGSCGASQAGDDIDVPRQRPTGEGPLRTVPYLPLEDLGDVGHETTRVIGAAVHRDPALAANLISEFLVEPKRSIAWSRGLDNVAVLTDAVASFRRCQYRDLLLVGLGVMVLIATPFAALVWLALAMFAAACGIGRTYGLPAANEDRRRASVVTGLVVAGAPLTTVAVLFVLGIVAQFAGGHVGTLGQVIAALSWSLRAGLGALALIVVVLAAYALVEFHLLSGSFSRSGFMARRASTSVSPWRMLGQRRFRSALGRVRQAEMLYENCADVVVFRGDTPFCGAGAPARTRAVAMTLESVDDDGSPPVQGLERLLHQAIKDAMLALRKSVPLSPHHRLGQLRHREQVLIPAEELVRHAGDEDLHQYLPRGLDGPPPQDVDVDVARAGIDRPHEWARYYQYFAVEAWERDLVVSCYVTLGTDRRYLYLQWTPCGLLPLDTALRDELDDVRRLRRHAVRRLLAEVVTLPASLPSRYRRAARRFRPIRPPLGAVSPQQFGADLSVREMASESGRGQWFQRSDARRYVILFDRVMIEAVRTCLIENGFSPAEFDRAAQTIVNNFGDISNSVVAAGAGNTATLNGGPAPGPLDTIGGAG